MNLNLLLAIKKSGKRQWKIAADSGIHSPRFSNILNQNSRPPTDTEKAAIARAMRKAIADLFPDKSENVSSL